MSIGFDGQTVNSSRQQAKAILEHKFKLEDTVHTQEGKKKQQKNTTQQTKNKKKVKKKSTKKSQIK